MKTPLRFVLLFTLLLPVTACEDIFGADDDGVSLSFAVPRTAGSASAAVVSDPVTLGGHTLDIQSAEVVFQHLVFERSAESSGREENEGTTSDFDGTEANDQVMLDGPITIALPLNGGVVTPATENLPAGVYGEIEAEISAVRVKGTYDGQAFEAVIRVQEGFEIDLEPAFDVSSSEKLNITLNVNVNSWFRSGTTLIDPRTVDANATLRLQARARIAQSFLAVHDDDRDGRSDR